MTESIETMKDRFRDFMSEIKEIREWLDAPVTLCEHHMDKLRATLDGIIDEYDTVDERGDGT